MHDVVIEPELQLLSREDFPLQSANTEDHVGLDVAGVYRFGRTMIDVWVFNPFVHSNRNLTLPSAYGKHEQKNGAAMNSVSWKWSIPHSSLSSFPQLEARGRQQQPSSPGLLGSYLRSAANTSRSPWHTSEQGYPLGSFVQLSPVCKFIGADQASTPQPWPFLLLLNACLANATHC